VKTYPEILKHSKGKRALRQVWRDIMRKLYVCGSFRFVQQMKELEGKLKGENIEYQISKEIDERGILGCLAKIDEADVVYVVNPGGYVGRSVCVDIGYAYARNKPIYAMHSVDDPSVMGLMQGVLSFEELIDFLKRGGRL
jgi:nucleoside 2-deoxyribosyltransferase